ncbi:MAG TPA: hypothetical protein VKA34_20730 [Balneolales bacterium]|nr:hypothetical protein [Balneolales bacterium]
MYRKKGSAAESGNGFKLNFVSATIDANFVYNGRQEGEQITGLNALITTLE